MPRAKPAELSRTGLRGAKRSGARSKQLVYNILLTEVHTRALTRSPASIALIEEQHYIFQASAECKCRLLILWRHCNGQLHSEGAHARSGSTRSPNDWLALVGFFPRNVGFRSPFKKELKKGMRQRLISRGVLVRLNEERMGSTRVCLMPFLSIMYFASQRESLGSSFSPLV